MTTEPAPRRRAPKRPGPGAVIFASLAAFLAVLALLSFRLGSGRDPALASEPAEAPQARKVVVVRRVVTRVIVDDGGRANPAPAPAATEGPAPAAPPPPPPPPPPVTRSS